MMKEITQKLKELLEEELKVWKAAGIRPTEDDLNFRRQLGINVEQYFPAQQAETPPTPLQTSSRRSGSAGSV